MFFYGFSFFDVTQNLLVVCWSLITNQRCVNSQKNKNLKYSYTEGGNPKFRYFFPHYERKILALFL
jgi:hypothetical protein